jgi:hypothetical protein
VARKTLDDILSEDDQLGLLSNLKPAPSAAGSEDQRVRQKFEDINMFRDRNGRVPGDISSGQKVSPSEKMLQFALNGIKGDAAIVALLKPFDRHALLAHLEPPPPPVASLDDIIASDDELLSTPVDDIFTFRQAPLPKAKSDRTAERRPCADFASFKPLFDACAEDLKMGRRKTLEFKNEQEIEAGSFFILNGTMTYVAEVNEPHIRNGKTNARLRLIFDNGTEGDNLLRSLSAELYKDGPAGKGRRITAPEGGPLFTGRYGFEVRAKENSGAGKVPGFAEDEKHSGEIYVVRSLSSNPEIGKLDGYLFKIGFTTGSVEARIAAAKDDPTFLLAPVHPVKAYRVYNINTAKMENLLHRFFGDARLDIEIMDRFGKPFRPREWFLVPIEIIDRAISMLIDGSIVRHRYDRAKGQIVEVEKS